MIDLSKVEYYDNHTLETILSCPRKAFWNKIFEGGYDGGVGAGANFGTCMHAALATYYHHWGSLSEPARRIKAFRRFEVEHSKLFPENVTEERRHSLESGLAILDHYFDQYLSEDTKWRPLAVELLTAVPITFESESDPEPFDSFLYVARADGIFEHVETHDLYVGEHKNVKQDPKYEIERLAINRQTTGYVYAFRQHDPRVRGVLANVIQIAADLFRTQREVYIKNDEILAAWRRQTIEIVREWRAKRDRDRVDGSFSRALDLYYQNDRQCTNYGKCQFWDACYRGVEFVRMLPKNTWTPMHVREE